MSDHDPFLPGLDDVELQPLLRATLADAATWAVPPDGLDDRILMAIESEALLGPAPDAPSVAGRWRTWLRPALAGAAAAIVLLFGGVVVLSALSGSDDVEPATAQLVSTGLVADVAGDVEFRPWESGLRIDLDARGLPRRDGGRYYEAWLRTGDDRLVPVGTFHSGENVVLWAGVEPGEVVAFSITAEEAATATSAEQASSGEVVLRADVRLDGGD